MQYLLVFAQYCFPLFTFPYLTRALTPQGYGIVTYISAFTSYLNLIIDFGFILSGTKEIVECHDDKKMIGHVLAKIIYAKLALFLICMIIFIVSIITMPIIRQNIAFSVISLFSVIFTIFLPDFLFRGLERMEILTYRYILSKAVTTILTFIVVKDINDILYIPFLNALGNMISVALTWYSIRYSFSIRIEKAKAKEAIDEIKASFLYFVSNIATTIYGLANTIIIGFFLPVEQIAYWGTAYTIISAAQSLYGPIINSLYPRMLAEADFCFIKKIFLIFMPLILICTGLTFIFADKIIMIIGGSGYRSAIPIFKMLLPVPIFSFPAMLFGWPLLGAIGKEKETVKTTVIASLFHLVGLIILIVWKNVTVVNICILRVSTEFVLLLSRAVIIRNIFQSKAS